MRSGVPSAELLLVRRRNPQVRPLFRAFAVVFAIILFLLLAFEVAARFYGSGQPLGVFILFLVLSVITILTLAKIALTGRAPHWFVRLFTGSA